MNIFLLPMIHHSTFNFNVPYVFYLNRMQLVEGTIGNVCTVLNHKMTMISHQRLMLVSNHSSQGHPCTGPEAGYALHRFSGTSFQSRPPGNVLPVAKGLLIEGACLTPDSSERGLADTPATPAHASVATDVVLGVHAGHRVRCAVAGLVGPALVTHTPATEASALASAHPVRYQ